ncbi:EamA family transporter [Cohnella herbarum]|uniref:DMT family transporter n=1 Tax=Cohnella herbarum TaxID=2728023 RepID=A0A7Z2ZMG1_9BACL|nr:DMT family transporter [Cohnella herbarum]QJD85043.1 DMT family transporter [Cohnella herbarum]
MNGTKKPILAIVLVLVGAASYGLLSAVFKLAIADGWGVNQLTFQQVFSGAVLLWLALGVARLRGSKLVLAGNWKAWIMLIATGVIGLSLTTVLYNECLSRLDASLGIVLLFQFTWITILLESIRKRQWPTRQEWIAVLCIAIGTVLAVGVLQDDFGKIDGWGVVFGLLSAVAYSLFFFLSGFLPQQMDPIGKSTIMSTASLLFVILLQTPGTIAESFDVSLMGWGLLLGFLGTAFPFFCFNYGIPKVGSGLAALLGSMELPAAVLAASVLLGEPLTIGQGAGIILIIAGIMAAQQKSPGLVTVGKEGES